RLLRAAARIGGVDDLARAFRGRPGAAARGQAGEQSRGDRKSDPNGPAHWAQPEAGSGRQSKDVTDSAGCEIILRSEPSGLTTTRLDESSSRSRIYPSCFPSGDQARSEIPPRARTTTARSPEASDTVSIPFRLTKSTCFPSGDTANEYETLCAIVRAWPPLTGIWRKRLRPGTIEPGLTSETRMLRPSGAQTRVSFLPPPIRASRCRSVPSRRTLYRVDCSSAFS